MDDPIVFKCEDSLWQMMAEEGVTGIPAKPFDMRRHDMADDRIYRLSMSTVDAAGTSRPDIEAITFLNVATRETMTRCYLGMEFVDWAPGWCFLLVGERVK